MAAKACGRLAWYCHNGWQLLQNTCGRTVGDLLWDVQWWQWYMTWWWSGVPLKTVNGVGTAAAAGKDVCVCLGGGLLIRGMASAIVAAATRSS